MHELDAERLAIGAAQDRDDLAHGREFETEHLVEENLAIEIGFGEAVGARIEFFLVLFRLEPERIELGVEMTADAVGADEHQRVNGIARRLLHVGGREFDAARLRLAFDLVADRLLGLGPVAVERGDEIAIARAAASSACARTRPSALLVTLAGSSFRLWKKACHSASTEAGSAS